MPIGLAPTDAKRVTLTPLTLVIPTPTPTPTLAATASLTPHLSHTTPTLPSRIPQHHPVVATHHLCLTLVVALDLPLGVWEDLLGFEVKLGTLLAVARQQHACFGVR